MVATLRGSLFGSVPLPAPAGGGPAVATLATGGGVLFAFSGGNTTRGPDRVTSTGASSRGTIFSVPSPAAIRSGTLDEPSAGAGTTLVGLLSARMIGGS